MKSSEFIEKYIRPVVNVMVPPEVQREGELLNATEQIIALGPILELQKIFHSCSIQEANLRNLSIISYFNSKIFE